MRSRKTEAEPLVNLSDISEIELVILKRLREMTMGDHRSRMHGSGFDFLGLRDWQAGDKFSSIDWAQSSLQNFSPMVIREFEQPSNAKVVAIADLSMSTRCGADGTPIAATVARAIATVGLSAVFFQDPFGLITFDDGFRRIGAIRPRTGKSHVVHCLEAYQHEIGLQPEPRRGDISLAIGAHLRSRTLVAVISDFLFVDLEDVLHELTLLNATHDVFLILIDSSYAFQAPAISAGWIDAVDVETGRSITLSRASLAHLAEQAREWQDELRRAAKERDLDVVEIDCDTNKSDLQLAGFVAERKLRKMSQL
jgi:uncharacterized protein (DUF58 family)